MYVAANGPRGVRLAIHHADGWVTTGLAPFGAENDTWWKGVAAAAERFNDAADRAGGTPAGFTRHLDLQPCADLATSAEQVRDAIGRAGDLGFTDVVIAWPREHGIFQGSEAVLEQIASHLDSKGELEPNAT
jgi:alkanesulfonate monooxygenase SsuD/methylene tetrahydromethanopterin reductase-like flavin-dependent oxidoreductase (luciferase family)